MPMTDNYAVVLLYNHAVVVLLVEVALVYASGWTGGRVEDGAVARPDTTEGEAIVGWALDKKQPLPPF